MVKYVNSIKFGENGETYVIKDSSAQAAIENMLEGDTFVETDQGIENAGKLLSVDNNGKVVPTTVEIPSVEGLASEQYVDSAIEEVEDKIPSIEGLASEQYVDSALEGKQNVLTAGTNITIENDIISATGGAGASSFSELVGDPMDNSALADALNAKADASDLQSLEDEVDTKQDVIDSEHKLAVALVDGALTASDIAGKADSATTLAGYGIEDAYTKTEVDGLIPSISGLATEQYVDNAVDTVEGKIPDVSDLATKSEVEAVEGKIPDVSDLATKSEVEAVEQQIPSIEGLATEEYVDNAVAEKQDELESGVNIKTINGQPILGEGDLTVEASGVDELREEVEENEANYQQDKYDYILEHHPASPNLYDASLMIDHKLINFTPYPSPDNYLNTYADSILSGFVPVEEGKTYTISIDKGNGTKVNAGGLCFVNATKGSVVGYSAQSQWEKNTNKAEVTYDSTTRNNTFTVKEGSGIRYVVFYIKSSTGSDNYWGAHEDLSVVANYKIMLNEGSEALPYEPPYEAYDTVRYEDADNVLREEVQTSLDNFESEMEVAVEEMVDEALTDINSDMQEFVIDERPSTNLYDSSLMVDHKLINYGAQISPDGSFVNYADSILSGYVPVEEGKTYTIKIRDGQGRAVNCGALCFYKLDGNNKHVGVCGCNYSGSRYGGGSNYWTGITGFVQNSYNDAALTNTFTILEGSDISSVVFYIKKYGSSSGNYWGSHEDLSVVADYQIQLNEGTTALPYEPSGIIRKAKWKEADEQIQLDLAEQMEDFRADMEDEVGSLVGNPKLTLTMSSNGNSWQIESVLKDQLCGEHQVKSTGTITANRTNHIFEFENTYIDGQQIKGASDDITPMNGSCPGRWSNTYIGGNHGQSNGYTLTFAEPHGKTNDDIGSVWAKGSTQYVIYEVPSTTTVRVVNTLTTPGTGAGTMTHVSGATHTEDMVYTSAAMDQLYRAVNKVTIHVYDENWKEIPVDRNGVYKSNKFRFVQTYDILAPDKAVQHIKEMKADGQSVTRDNLYDDGIQAFARQNICYEYSEGNACTVYMRSDFLDTFTGFHGVVQSGAISGTPTASSPEYCYVAGWNNNTPYENYGTDTPSTDFPKSKWDDQSNPPYRYYQFGYGTRRPMGMMQGYYTKIGVGIPSVRTQVLGNSAGFCYTSGKMYPYAYSGKTLQAGDVRETVAFYSPLIMDMTNDNCFASIYNYVYDDIILAIDYQEAADVLYRLRPECVGKQIEVLDKTDNVTMDRTMASSEKLPITFEGKGWIVLRFYDEERIDDYYVHQRQGTDKAGYFLKVNSNGNVVAEDVAGLTVDTELDEESIHAIANAPVATAINEVNNYLFSTRPSTNLFENSMMIDHKILNFDPNSPEGTWAAGIIAKVPVEEGKTYTVSNVYVGGSTNTYIHLGAVCFVNSAGKGVFGVQATTPTYSYGYHMSGKPDWPVDTSKVTISYNSTTKSNTFTVLEGSDIKYVYFYIRGINTGDNYWGEHTDLSVVTSDYHIQVNEGTQILPYETGGEKPVSNLIEKATNITVADSTATDVATLVSNFNTLLQALRDRNVLADS